MSNSLIGPEGASMTAAVSTMSLAPLITLTELDLKELKRQTGWVQFFSADTPQ
jgi:hypothetical protein